MAASPLVLWFDLMGVFFFALSGNLLAARKDIDITGGLVLGLLAGLGGGIIRDVLLGVTPLALAKPVYLIPPVVAAVAVYLIGPHLLRIRTLIVTFDAGGLGLFCTFGTARALDHGMPVASALGLGVVTAVGGGLMRDVVANEIPAVFNGSNLYVVPAATGAGLTAIAVQTDLWGPVSATLLSAFVFSFRMVAWFKQWRVPAPVRGWSVRDIDARLRRERSVFGRPRRDVGRGAEGPDKNDHDDDHDDDNDDDHDDDNDDGDPAAGPAAGPADDSAADRAADPGNDGDPDHSGGPSAGGRR